VELVGKVEKIRHFLKWEYGSTRAAWMPMAAALNPGKARDFLANQFGYTDSAAPVENLAEQIKRVPHVLGIPRLGWTPTHDAFMFGPMPLYTGPTHPTYEFFAPEGTLLHNAAQALTPKGSRDEQYKAFRGLWGTSDDFKLVMALAAVSPFLEIVGAPPIAFHVAGPSGVGKTTLLRLAVSVYADPDSPLTKVDLSKDTQNYADAQCGILHNFPLLLDETTLSDPKDLARAAYQFAVGRSKGRLTGPEQNYVPAEPLTYTLVCFMSGETSIRDEFENGGGAARLIELPTEGPLLAKDQLPTWYGFPTTHWGWMGRDVVQRVIDRGMLATDEGGLRFVYGGYRAVTGEWCDGHARMLDFLAAVQVGYRLAGATLFGTDPGHDQAQAFAQGVYRRLNKATKVDDVLAACQADRRITVWADRGFVPLDTFDGVAGDYGMPRVALVRLLKTQSVVTKLESRTIKDPTERSVRCAILTPRGQAWLSRSAATGPNVVSPDQ